MSQDGDPTVTILDGDIVDVAIVTLDLGNPVNRKHADKAARALTVSLVLVATVACFLTVFASDLLRGPAVMNGSARGTALIVAIAAVPCACGGMFAARRGSARGRVLWAGGLAYILYNSVMLCFATPFNDLFLLYVAMLGLSFWALLATLVGTPFADHWRPHAAKPVAAYIATVVTLNAFAWLTQIVPAIGDRSPDFLAGTGMSTNPIHVQDLAIWLPAMAAAAAMRWTRHPWALLVSGTGLIFWQLEAAGVAVDQWFGHAADPTSPVASLAGIYGFAALFIVGLVPTWAVLRRIPSA